METKLLNELHARQRDDGAWYAEIRSEHGELVGVTTSPDKSYAEVRAKLFTNAVNEREELIAALEKIVDLSKPGQTIDIHQAIDILADIWDAAHDLLAKAKARARE